MDINNQQQIIGYCRNCGQAILQGTTICGSCGAPVYKNAPPENTVLESGSSGQASERNLYDFLRKKGKRGLLKFLSRLLAFIGLEAAVLCANDIMYAALGGSNIGYEGNGTAASVVIILAGLSLFAVGLVLDKRSVKYEREMESIPLPQALRTLLRGPGDGEVQKVFGWILTPLSILLAVIFDGTMISLDSHSVMESVGGITVFSMIFILPMFLLGTYLLGRASVIKAGRPAIGYPGIPGGPNGPSRAGRPIKYVTIIAAAVMTVLVIAAGGYQVYKNGIGYKPIPASANTGQNGIKEPSASPNTTQKAGSVTTTAPGGTKTDTGTGTGSAAGSTNTGETANELLIEQGENPGDLKLTMTGNKSEYCFDTPNIKMGPNLKVPLALFDTKVDSDNKLSFAIRAKSITIRNSKVTTKFGPDGKVSGREISIGNMSFEALNEDRYIKTGAQGAVIKKDGDSLTVISGSIQLLNN